MPDTQRRPKKKWIPAIVILGIIALGSFTLFSAVTRLREVAFRVPCAGNLKVIGQALLLYTQDHDGRYPQRLEELLGELPKVALVCALSEQPSVFVVPGAMARDLTEEDVVAHEPLSAHGGVGANVLYGDGRVKWLTAAELERDLARATTRAATQSSK